MVAVFLTSSIVKSGSLHCSVRCSKALRVLERNAGSRAKRHMNEVNKLARSVLRGLAAAFAGGKKSAVGAAMPPTYPAITVEI